MLPIREWAAGYRREWDDFTAPGFTDDSTPKCPGCGTRSKKNISKVFGAVGISFKGDGFYKNDHGSKAGSSSSSSSLLSPFFPDECAVHDASLDPVVGVG